MKKNNIIVWLLFFLLLFNFSNIFFRYDDMFVEAGWYNGWTYKKQITLDKSQVPNTLSNFPVLINLSSDSDLASFAQGDGDDILFTDENDNKLNHEIEFYDGSTGRLVAWVNITTLNGTGEPSDTVIYMYFGNPYCSNQQNITGVWDSDYLAVYHMNDTSDSTGDYDLTNNGAAYTSGGIAGGCYDFELGETDWMEQGSLLDVAPFDLTISCWFKLESNAADQSFVGKANDAYNYWVLGEHNTNMSLKLVGKHEANLARYYYEKSITVDNWYCAAGVYENNQQLVGYVNSTSSSGGIVYTKPTDGFSQNFHIGAQYVSDRSSYVDGVIDEVRISQTVRNNDWLTTEYNTMRNSTDGGFFTLGGKSSHIVELPTSFAVSTMGNGSINISFAKGVNATNTYVEYNTVSSWDLGDGTMVYNDTGDYFVHNSLSCGIVYYYQGWSYNSSWNQFSISYVTGNNLSCPSSPSSTDGDPITSSSINISWTNGLVGVDRSIVVVKIGGFPFDYNDGTEIYNDTGLYYVYNSHSSSKYYNVFHYNATVNRFSSGVDVLLGSLTINVYREENNASLSAWGILIRNNDGSEYYINNSCSNPLILDTETLPIGDNIFIRISKNGYSNKTYYMDIEINTEYVLNCYLAKNTSVDSYILRVIDEYDNAIDGARIQIKRFINDSMGYQNVTIVQTGGDGYVTVDLIPNIAYLAIISKSGYITSYEDITPIPVVYGDERYIPSFVLVRISSGETSVMDNISLTIEPNVLVHTGSIDFYFNITSELSDMDFYRMKIYQLNTSIYSWVLIYSGNDTTISGGSLSYTTGDVVGLYGVSCSFKHGDWNVHTLPFRIYTIYHPNITGMVNPSDINTKINNVIGLSPVYLPGVVETIVAWTSLIVTFVVIFVCFTFSPKFSGFAIMALGAVLGFFKEPLNIIEEATISMTAVVIIFILGIMVVIITNREG